MMIERSVVLSAMRGRTPAFAHAFAADAFATPETRRVVEASARPEVESVAVPRCASVRAARHASYLEREDEGAGSEAGGGGVGAGRGGGRGARRTCGGWRP